MLKLSMCKSIKYIGFRQQCRNSSFFSMSKNVEAEFQLKNGREGIVKALSTTIRTDRDHFFHVQLLLSQAIFVLCF